MHVRCFSSHLNVVHIFELNTYYSQFLFMQSGSIVWALWEQYEICFFSLQKNVSQPTEPMQAAVPSQLSHSGINIKWPLR